ncbi:MAG: Rne/Rng family ribonuclease [Beutenbergiaceae bacterium]
MDNDDVSQDTLDSPNTSDSTNQPARRRSRRATRPAGTPDAPAIDVLAEFGLIDAPATDDGDAPAADAEDVPAADDDEADAPSDEDDAPPSADEADEESVPDDADEDAPRLPATALLFQAPDLTPRRRRRASAPAGAPTTNADERAELAQPDPADQDQAADASGESEDTANEGDDSPTPKRRRRRGGRGRRKSKSSSEPGSESEADTGDVTADGAGEGAAEPKGEGQSKGGKSKGSKKSGKQSDSEQTTKDKSGKDKSGKDKSGKDKPNSAEDGGSGDADQPDKGGSEGGGSSRRRRRRRSRSGRDDGSRARDQVTALKGSTRLEAKRQRRRDGRDANRRRAIITEAEFLARRESVERSMVVREHDGRTQIAVLEDDILVEHFVARKTQTSMVGNVYLGRVQNVLPSMEAAFVDVGRGRNAVLYAGEVNWDAAGLDGQPRRIEQALSSGDSVLVQVTKDPIGQKGARLTSQITLAGRYLVLVPSGAMTGISRKLPDTERNRLKKILKEIVPSGHGVIVRTAAEGATEEELRRDVERLTKSWADIEQKAAKPSTSAPTLLKGEPELATRVVRDVFNEDFRSLTVSGNETWKTISEYVTSVAPDLVERLHHWTDAKDVFAAHRIDEQLAKGLDRKVWLPSGGSLVIDRTEAMTVIDVNTGKFTGSGGTLEETVTKNNLEAAEEIVRQLRLRDIGGIIVVDFIDMVLESNRDLVLRRLVECLGRDRTRHQVAEVTSLGLVQMTRKRVGQGLVEAFSRPCEHCHGRGIVMHDEPVDGAHTHADADEAPRSGRGRGSRRQQAAPEPAEDDEQRAQVRATLATIAAAAAHAHDEQDGEEPKDDSSAPVAEDALPTVVEVDTEALAANGSTAAHQSAPADEMLVAETDEAPVAEADA